MISKISKEIELVQNPSLGAGIIWRFICGYFSGNQKSTPFPLLFIVLPMIFREDILYEIYHTNKSSGLTKVSQKMFACKKNDLLFNIHTSADYLKDLTLESIRIGLATSLIAIEKESGSVFPLTRTSYKKFSKPVKDHLSASEKLGFWCSKFTIYEISRLLRVRF